MYIVGTHICVVSRSLQSEEPNVGNAVSAVKKTRMNTYPTYIHDEKNALLQHILIGGE
jgi:hypothetical protein